MQFHITFPVVLFILELLYFQAEAKQNWVRRCKRSTDNWLQAASPHHHSNNNNFTDNSGCTKNVWVPMDRASKCPQLNGAITDVELREAPVQPRLYGRRGVYSAHCEYMVIVVRQKGCQLLETDDIEFKCHNNFIFYEGREVTSFVCAESVY